MTSKYHFVCCRGKSLLGYDDLENQIRGLCHMIALHLTLSLFFSQFFVLGNIGIGKIYLRSCQSNELAYEKRTKTHSKWDVCCSLTVCLFLNDIQLLWQKMYGCFWVSGYAYDWAPGPEVLSSSEIKYSSRRISLHFIDRIDRTTYQKWFRFEIILMLHQFRLSRPTFFMQIVSHIYRVFLTEMFVTHFMHWNFNNPFVEL